MLLTSHRLDCLKISLDLLDQSGSLPWFDRVVLLLNGVEGRHRRYVDDFIASRTDTNWDIIAGPRGRGERISGLQNQCVERYPDSLYFKIDEDTFVWGDWQKKLLTAYQAHADDPRLSLVTPVIANNGIGFYYLLHLFPELATTYREQFGYPLVPDCDGPVWKYPRVAEWITRNFLDLEEANEKLQTTEPNQPINELTNHPQTSYRTFAQRFSINCICYDYRHWNEIGGVPEHDEMGWGAWIPENNKYVVLAHDAFAHHYSFFVQQAWLDRTSLLEDLRMCNLPETMPRKTLVNYHLPRWMRIARQVPDKCRRILSGE